MKEISDNDYRALELARELFSLKNDWRANTDHVVNGKITGESVSRWKSMKDRQERIEWALEEWSKGEDIIAAMLADPRDDQKTRDTLAFHHSAWAKAAMRNAITVQHTTSGNAVHTNVTLKNALDNSLAAFGNALDHFNKQKGA